MKAALRNPADIVREYYSRQEMLRSYRRIGLWASESTIVREFGDKVWKGEYHHYINPFSLKRLLVRKGFELLYPLQHDGREASGI